MRASGSLLCECGCVGVFWGPAGDGARDPGSSSELQHQPPLRRAGCPGSCLGCMRGHLGQGLERALEKCCYRVGWMLFKVFRESSISFDVEVTYAAGRVLFGACIRDECPVPAYLRRGQRATQMSLEAQCRLSCLSHPRRLLTAPQHTQGLPIRVSYLPWPLNY